MNPAVRAEAWALLELAVPLMATTMLGYTMNIVDLAMVGHLGTQPLAAAALGNTVFNSVYYFVIGVAGALDTFMAQAHGAQSPAAMRSWLGRGVASLLLLLVPASALLACTEPLLRRGLGQSPELSRMAGQFVMINIPGMWCLVLFTALQKWLQVQHVLGPMVALGVLANLINLAANLLLIRWIGFLGAPLATTCSRIFQLLAGLAYLWVSDRPKVHLQPTKIFSGCGWPGIAAFLSLGLPAGVMVAMEAWSFELTTLFVAAARSTTEVDAHIIMLNICGFTFLSFPLGISIAATIRVGALLGSGQPSQAKLTAALAVCGGAGFMTICAGAIMGLGGRVAWLFTSDQAVVDVVARCSWLLALMQIFDGIQGCAAGALRGMAKQRMVALANLVLLMGLGLGLGSVLVCLTELGVLGCWVGMDSGLAVLSAVLVIGLASSDWSAAATEASKLVQAGAKQPGSAQAVVDVALEARDGFEKLGAEPTTPCTNGLHDCAAHSELDSHPMLIVSPQLEDSVKEVLE